MESLSIYSKQHKVLPKQNSEQVNSGDIARIGTVKLVAEFVVVGYNGKSSEDEIYNKLKDLISIHLRSIFDHVSEEGIRSELWKEFVVNEYTSELNKVTYFSTGLNKMISRPLTSLESNSLKAIFNQLSPRELECIAKTERLFHNKFRPHLAELYELVNEKKELFPVYLEDFRKARTKEKRVEVTQQYLFKKELQARELSLFSNTTFLTVLPTSNKLHELKISNLQNKIVTLESTISNLKNKLQVNEKELELSKVTALSLEEVSSNRILDLERENKSLKAESENMVKIVNTLNESCMDLKSGCESLGMQLKILEEQSEFLKNQINDLESQNESLKAQLKSLVE